MVESEKLMGPTSCSPFTQTQWPESAAAPFLFYFSLDFSCASQQLAKDQTYVFEPPEKNRPNLNTSFFNKWTGLESRKRYKKKLASSPHEEGCTTVKKKRPKKKSNVAGQIAEDPMGEFVRT